MSKKSKNIKLNNILKKGVELMKRRSVYECAEYCYRNSLDIKTFKHTNRPVNPIKFIFNNESWYEYYKKKTPSG